MPVPCHTWMPETLTMMMLLAPLRPSQLWRGIKSQFFTRAAPSADDPRAEIARLSVSQRAAFKRQIRMFTMAGPCGAHKGELLKVARRMLS